MKGDIWGHHTVYFVDIAEGLNCGGLLATGDQLPAIVVCMQARDRIIRLAGLNERPAGEAISSLVRSSYHAAEAFVAASAREGGSSDTTSNASSRGVLAAPTEEEEASLPSTKGGGGDWNGSANELARRGIVEISRLSATRRS